MLVAEQKIRDDEAAELLARKYDTYGALSSVSQPEAETMAEYLTRKGYQRITSILVRPDVYKYSMPLVRDALMTDPGIELSLDQPDTILGPTGIRTDEGNLLLNGLAIWRLKDPAEAAN